MIIVIVIIVVVVVVVYIYLTGKNQRLSSNFDSCCRNEVSNFHLRKFVPFWGQKGADVHNNNKNSKINSGSNKTVLTVLASIYIFLQKFELLFFHPIRVKEGKYSDPNSRKTTSKNVVMNSSRKKSNYVIRFFEPH